jgi:hypothetical protein
MGVGSTKRGWPTRVSGNSCAQVGAQRMTPGFIELPAMAVMEAPLRRPVAARSGGSASPDRTRKPRVPKCIVGNDPDSGQAHAAWALLTRSVEAGQRASAAAGRIGRETSSPAQLGQSPSNRFLAQVTQKVHSKLHILASAEAGVKSTSQHSQLGRSWSMVFLYRLHR